ncbi:TPA: hypothetical protein KD876_004739 [Vibrio parahaemolyticus]|nr:hypothetical protein [Vibrio parahaemolyticus]
MENQQINAPPALMHAIEKQPQTKSSITTGILVIDAILGTNGYSTDRMIEVAGMP